MYKYLLFLAAVFLGSKAVHADNGTFWHVTDIHVDQNYSSTGDTKYFCHQNGEQQSDYIGRYGNFLCDSPEILVNLTIESMRIIEPNPDFIIWTGDNLPHVWKPDDPGWSTIYEALANLTSLLISEFPEVPIYPSIGNHDSFPPNILVPQLINDSMYLDYLDKGGWREIIPNASWATFLKGGYYSTQIKPGLNLISLNTILWYEPNENVTNLMDPADQFQWMENVLKDANDTKEKVYIIGHVPPGFYNRASFPLGPHKPYMYHPQFLKKYLNITGKYYGTIAGQFFGHLHMDTFQLFQYDSGVTHSSSLLASSVTPWHAPTLDGLSLPVNPSIRLMHFERNNGSLMDYDQYYLNLTKANESPEKEPSYEHLYSFVEAYGVPDVSTESLYKVYEQLKSDDKVFNRFIHYMTAGEDSTMCGDHCKTAQLCAMICTSMEEYLPCMQTSNGLMHNSSLTQWPSSSVEGLSFPANPSDGLMHHERSNHSLISNNHYDLNSAVRDEMGAEKEHYFLPYSFTEVYGVPDILMALLHKVYEKLKPDIGSIFDHYMTAGEDSTAYCHKSTEVIYSKLETYLPSLEISDVVVTPSCITLFTVMGSLIVIFVVMLVAFRSRKKKRSFLQKQRVQCNEFYKFL